MFTQVEREPLIQISTFQNQGLYFPFVRVDNTLHFTCECLNSIPCDEMLKMSLFPLNALVNPVFRDRFQSEFELVMLETWDSNHSIVIPIFGEIPQYIELFYLWELFLMHVEDVFSIPSTLDLLKFKVKLEESEEAAPLILQSFPSKKKFVCWLPLVDYALRGLNGVLSTCECGRTFGIIQKMLLHYR